MERKVLPLYLLVFVIVLISEYKGTAVAICPSNRIILHSPSGTFSSPNYPSQYPSNVRKTWKITAPVGQVIHLYFSGFELEGTSRSCSGQCGCDFVKIRNQCDGVPIATFCGYMKKPIRSNSNVLWVEFRSDDSDNRKGFKAIYTMSSKSSKLISCPRPSDNQANIDYCFVRGKVQCCNKDLDICKVNKILSSTSGTITSPGYPDNYPNNVLYYWRITVPEGYVVQLNFTASKTHHTDSCSTLKSKCNCDFVQAVDGPCRYNIGTRWCGDWSSKNPSFITTGRHMVVVFKSDWFYTHVGFSADYRWALKCGGKKPYSCLSNGRPACCKTQNAAIMTRFTLLWATMAVVTTTLLTM